MKTIKEKLNESLFRKKNTQNSIFKSKSQQWDNWCRDLLADLVSSFENYRETHPDYDPQTDSYPADFDEEVLKYANDKEDFSDALYCLYRCFCNNEFSYKDLGDFGSRVKFVN